MAVKDNHMEPTAIQELDVYIRALKQNADSWLKVSIPERIVLLEKIIEEYGKTMETWVEISLANKEAVDDPYAIGMEWIGGPTAVLRFLRGLQKALHDVQEKGVPGFPGPVSSTDGGQVVAKIYPRSLYERIITPGVIVDVIMEKGISPEGLSSTQAIAYISSDQKGKVALVLGAGNVSGIPMLDALFKMFIENQVVILKMNPVNEYLGPLIEKCMSVLISRNFLRVCYGGAEVGTYISRHASIDEIHLTGSVRTYEAIIFGSGEEGRKRKKDHLPLLNKRFTAELGNVGPVIVIPGAWNKKEIHYQAEQVVANLCDNAGFSCSRGRVVLTHSNWELNDVFIQEIRNILKEVPSRNAYYPGSHLQYQQFLQAHPEAEKYGKNQGNYLPWTFIPGIDPGKEDICFRMESFCPVIALASLEGKDSAEFIGNAVKFCNEHLWGTLSAAILVNPASERNPKVVEAINAAVADLRYGQIIFNGLGGISWAMASPPWGGFPGTTQDDIQSGTGFSNNALMFSKPEKVVVRAPFMMWPEPIWFTSRAKTFARIARKVAYYDLKPSLWKLPGLVFSALKP